jgi:hypothetical protein
MTETAKPTSPEELARAKAAELSERFRATGTFQVHPIVFKDETTGEAIIGYFKEPTRAQKMAIMDRVTLGPMLALEELYPILLIKEESDPRMYSEDQAYDDVYMGAVMAVYNAIKMKVNTFKKNNRRGIRPPHAGDNRRQPRGQAHIRIDPGVFHLTNTQIDEMDDEDFWTTYYQAKYFASVAYAVKF